MKDYSIKKASLYAGVGLGIASLTGIFQAFAHHAQNDFDTLGEAFSYVAPPEIIAFTIATCATIGAGIELLNWYHKRLDAADRTKTPSTSPRR